MRRSSWTSILSCAGILVLILDTKTALSGAIEGIDLCIRAVIPSLFPFFVLSIILTSTLIGKKTAILRPVGRLCGMPSGSESLLLVGLLGGYPTGAQAVTQAYVSGHLPKQDAQRMLGFCSNAGPAFLFGMVAVNFPSYWYAWALWGIHILSAIIVGALLPCKSHHTARITAAKPISFSSALERAIKIMATVCGWVVLFRVIIAFFDRWFLWLLPDCMKTILIGILELSNGCCELGIIQDVYLRFIACSGILALGGLCVTMQTASVTKSLGMGMYFPGKVLQCLISLILSCLAMLNQPRIAIAMLIFGVIFIFLLLLLRKMRKKSSNMQPIGV